VPRFPCPIPRGLKIVFTRHAVRRCKLERHIDMEMVRDTIRTGIAFPSNELGESGGYISKFSKSFVEHSASSAVTKTIVAVCEIVADKCVVLTAYYA
jgi:hypothetical protein